jgi:hypothetical protein
VKFPQTSEQFAMWSFDLLKTSILIIYFEVSARLFIIGKNNFDSLFEVKAGYL